MVAIGIFDGVHRGHQAIVARAVQRARRLRTTPIALTFDPHPAAVLAPGREPTLLLSLTQRIAALKAGGIRRVVVLRFTPALSRWSPEQFVQRVLVRRLRAAEVVVGHDFGFGRGRQGTIAMLRALGRRYGFGVHVVPPVRVGRVRVASRLIRQAITRGQLDTAARYLGRPPMAVGPVVPGAGRGRRVGIPTANVQVTAGVLPPTGVYAVWARWGRAWVPGVANLGYRPTVDRRRPAQRPAPAEAPPRPSGQPVLEVHILAGRAPRLRGRELTVAFGRRLRPERRFPTVPALVAQIRRDIAAARRWLAH